METRYLLAITACFAFVLVVVNLRGALKLNLNAAPPPPILPNNEMTGKSKLPIQIVSMPRFNFTKRHNDNNNSREIVLIHVGKTGGETVRQTLQLACRLRRNPIEKQACQETFSKNNHTESALSKSTIGIMHCDSIQPSDDNNSGTASSSSTMARATTLVWTLRNPLDRIQSWFRYMNPINCRPEYDYYSTACNTNRSIRNGLEKKGSKWSVKFFSTCFHNMDQFAIAFSNTTSTGTTTIANTNTTSCSELAWRTIRGEGSASAGHAFFNYKYYWKQTMEHNRNKEVWVIRTESLWEDMQGIEMLLLGDTKGQNIPHYHLEKRNVTHGSEGRLQDDSLSLQGRQSLCCALQSEFAVYQDLMLLATNHDLIEKNRTLTAVANSCNVDSLEMLSRICDG